MHSPAAPSDPWAPSVPWTLSARVLSSPAKKHDEIAVNYDFREAGADIKLVKETSVSCAVGTNYVVDENAE